MVSARVGSGKTRVPLSHELASCLETGPIMQICKIKAKEGEGDKAKKVVELTRMRTRLPLRSTSVMESLLDRDIFAKVLGVSIGKQYALKNLGQVEKKRR